MSVILTFLRNHYRHGTDDDAINQHIDCDAMAEAVGGLTCEQHT